MKKLVIPACLVVALSGCETLSDQLAAVLAPAAGASAPTAAVPASAPQVAASSPPAAPAVAKAPPVAAPAVARGFAPPSLVTGAVRDPGPRSTPVAAGMPLAGLDAEQRAAFQEGRAVFIKEFGVKDGLGPLMNFDSCAGCHSHPAIGGSSGAINPQVAFASKLGATNTVPPFITSNGPARVVRFAKRPDGHPDGGVRKLFNVSGRNDTPAGCKLTQPDFSREFAANNIVTRIGLPLFGNGLIEQIPNQALIDNLSRNAARKAELGIRWKTNGFGRFGWKSQQSSLLVFTANAFNGEIGLSSDMFPLEDADTSICQVAATPNLGTDTGNKTTKAPARSDLERVASFVRYLAPPTPSSDTPGGSTSIESGRALFASVGCDLCHLPQLRTGNAAIPALRDKPVDLYSDLLLHDMGSGLADQVQQSSASGQDWRTTPLWGLGQRMFLLHDGRTTDVREAVLAHRSPGSEANSVVDKYIELSDAQEQDLLNFLRSL